MYSASCKWLPAWMLCIWALSPKFFQWFSKLERIFSKHPVSPECCWQNLSNSWSYEIITVFFLFIFRFGMTFKNVFMSREMVVNYPCSSNVKQHFFTERFHKSRAGMLWQHMFLAQHLYWSAVPCTNISCKRFLIKINGYCYGFVKIKKKIF